MNGNFTFQVDIADRDTLQMIMDNWFQLESSPEITRALKGSGFHTLVFGRQNLKQYSFKHSKGKPGVKTGNLINSMGSRLVHNKTKMLTHIGFRRGKGGGNHAHFLDRGTKERYTKRGFYRGSVQAGSPLTGSLFWTKAVEAGGRIGLNVVNDAIYRTLERISNK